MGLYLGKFGVTAFIAITACSDQGLTDLDLRSAQQEQAREEETVIDEGVDW